MNNFCGNCGAKMDTELGLCPNCDAEKIRSIRQKKERRRKLRIRAIIAGVLILVLLAGNLGGYLALSHQAEAAVNDYTALASISGSGGSSSGGDDSGDDGDSAVSTDGNADGSGGNSGELTFSQNVIFFVAEDADEVNDSIQSYSATNQGLYVTAEKDSPLSELGVGDVFFLEGSEDTPLGETYIGKVSSVDDLEDDTTTWLFETPTADEVFDELQIDYEETLTIDNIASIQTMDGTTVQTVSDVTSYFDTDEDATTTDAEEDSAQTDTEGNKEDSAQADTEGNEEDGAQTDTGEGEESTTANVSGLLGDKTEYGTSSTAKDDSDGLILDFEVDLLELLGLKEKTTVGFDEVSETEGYAHTVYITETGSCYHSLDCPYLYASSEEIALADAVNEGYAPCMVCTPPVLKGDSGVFSSKLALTGKIGFSELNVDLDYDWDIASGAGMDDLSVSLNGDFVGEVGLVAQLKWELSGDTTTITLPGSVVKLSGLDEKMFPIAFVTWNGSVNVQVNPTSDTIRQMTGVVPFTIGLMVYSDINGNIKIESDWTLHFDYDFELSYTMIEDGQWKGEFTKSGEPTLSVTFSTEVTGDADVTAIGMSALFYVYNLNILDVGIVKAGMEAEGTLKVSYTAGTHKVSDTWEGVQDGELTAYVYARLYAKVFDVKLKLKTKLNLLIFKLSNTLEYSYTWLDVTIVEWGTKYDAVYNSETMSHDSVTAQDESAVYYKDLTGYLIREEDGYRTTLYTEDFYCICGIDAVYIYLMIPSDDGYSVCRVAKEGGTNKTILKEVESVLTMDEKYLYYTSTFDTSVILRVDRSTLDEDEFASMGNEVTFMQPQGSYFYVVTTDSNDMWSWLFGSSYYYTLLNSSGSVVADYGSSPSIDHYYMEEVNGYYFAAKMISDGYLRSTAEEVYWMSGGKTQSVKAEGTSGWHSHDVGIFTVQEDSESSTGRKIVLYRASDGALVDVTEVSSSSSFFTLCQSKTGTWYYFDQTDTELILYAMSEDFSTKQAVRTFNLSEIPYDLESCSMTIRDNRIYFYSMPSDTESVMLYRYDLD